MHRNSALGYEALEIVRSRSSCAYKSPHLDDLGMGRRLPLAKPEEAKHRDEVLLHEERLSRHRLRRNLGLNIYGRKIERLMHALPRV